jgi:transcriptional regulator NrdR family protein
MVLLLAVAVMAVAVASWIIATTFRIRIRENMTDVAQARRLIQQIAERLQQAEKRLRTQSDHDQARWADEFETVRQQIGEAHVQLARHDAQIRQHEELLDDQGAEAGRAAASGPAQQELAALRQAVRDLDRRARQAEEAAAKSQGLGEQATAGLTDLRHQADLRLASLARDVARISRYLDGVRQYVRAQLDHDVMATRDQPGHRVLAGGICTEAPAAADILPLLYDSFLQQLPLDTLFHDSGRHYLLWRSRSGPPLEQRLAELLRACPDRTHPPIPGLTELRSLLLALYHAGPATLQVGPLVVFRTTDQFAGLVLAGGEADLLDGQSALPGPEECRSLLKTLGDDRLADLGPWADHQLA